MPTGKSGSWTPLGGEREFLAAVVANLPDDLPKLVYADWLEEHGDMRSHFLRAYVAAAKTMRYGDFFKVKGYPEEWLELVGYRLVERIATAGVPQLKDRVLRLARPALRMKPAPANETGIAVGVSKIGGLPDLPPGFAWPPGGSCHAIYNDDTGGTDRLAGFMAQINFAEIAHTQAAKDLPSTGVLSFFCFQDIENDNPDAIGARAIYFPDPTTLVRTGPPGKLTEGNGTMPSQRLAFVETLDLPETSDGPWSADICPGLGADYPEVIDQIREVNFHNAFGYARATSGGDPTPSKQSRHLVILNNAAGCQLHIQIDQGDLAARNFERITLAWVDFD